MINACIIDDEKNSREVLELMIRENHPDISIVGTAGDIAEGDKLIREKMPDVIFLDVEMPGGSGFELVKQLREPLPHIIFCTAYGHYAIRAIECSALAYLLKPVSSQKLQEAIQKVRKKQEPSERNLQRDILQEQLNQTQEATRFLVNTAEDIKVIRFDEVTCCVAESNYTRIHLSDGKKTIVSKTLKEIENILHKPYFFRIHHSYLINMNYIQRINKADGCIVELPHHIHLDVARSKKDELLTRIAAL